MLDNVYSGHKEYTNCELGWVEELPSHWDVAKLKYVSKLETGHTPSRNNPEYWEEGQIPWYSLADVSQVRERGRRFISKTNETITEAGIQNSSARILPKGTVLISRTASIGFPCILDIPSATDQSMVAWIPGENILSTYLHRVLQAMSQELDRLANGSTHETIYMSDVEDLSTPLPPKSEQKKIVSYIDKHVSIMEKLIEKKEKQKGLIVERKQLAIQNAVTGRIFSKCGNKESNIGWFGMIPSHWDVGRLGLFAEVTNGSTPSRDEPEYWEGGTIPWVASTKLNEKLVTEPSERVTERALDECDIQLIPPESVLIGLVGQGRTRGMSAMLGIESAINQNTAAVIPRRNIKGRYLYYLFQHMYEPIRSLGRGANQPALDCGTIANLDILVPPKSEQKKIVEYVEEYTKKIEKILDKVEKSIRLLQERRESLIYAAVTGQIDLSGWQPPDKQEVPL